MQGQARKDEAYKGRDRGEPRTNRNLKYSNGPNRDGGQSFLFKDVDLWDAIAHLQDATPIEGLGIYFFENTSDGDEEG